MSLKTSLYKSKLYNNRKLIAFFFVAFMLYIFIALGFARVPVGLSELELHSLSQAGGFSFPASFIDLPYHFLQWLSIHFLGPSVFSIRLVSIILGILTGGLVVLSVKNLIRSNVAIVTGLIISSSVFFLNYARLGAPMIMSMFLLALAIFAISKYLTSTKHRTLWVLITVFATVIGAYSPLGIYLLVALVLIAIFHPKVRLLVKRMKTSQVVVASIAAIALLLPLIFAIINQPSSILSLLGVDNLVFTPIGIWHNLQALIMPWRIDSFGFVTPFFNIVEVALIVIGLVTLIRQYYSARAQLFLGLGVLAFIISLLNITNAYILFIPYVFLISFGGKTIIDKWYSLFPVNPYAKLLGLMPLGVLIFGIIFSNFSQYNTSNFYSESVVYARDETYQALRDELTKLRAHNVTLVTNESNVKLYETLKSEFTNLTISQYTDNTAEIQILLPETFYQNPQQATGVITNGNSKDYVVLKIYQKK